MHIKPEELVEPSKSVPADFWEIPVSIETLESMSTRRALWFEDEEARAYRFVWADFIETVKPLVRELIKTDYLTDRQEQVVQMYFLKGMTQDEIARSLGLGQPTVSRHLFGTVREGKKVGGVIQKLRKLVSGENCPPAIQAAMDAKSKALQAA